MIIEADGEQITVRLEPMRGHDLDRHQIGACLDHALNESDSAA